MGHPQPDAYARSKIPVPIMIKPKTVSRLGKALNFNISATVRSVIVIPVDKEYAQDAGSSLSAKK